MKLRENHGGALMLAVGYLAIMTLAATGFLAMLHFRLSVVRDLERMQQCRHLAEAGIEAALTAAAENPADTGENHVPLGAGRYSVTVTPQSENQRLIESTGEIVYDGVVMEQRTIRVVVTFDAARRVQSLEWDVEPAP